MFETVSPETFRPRSRRHFYGSLPVSLGLHGAAVAAVILTATWNVSFPAHTPRMLALYQIASTRTPPPPPPPPAAAAKKVTAPTVRMPENVAPTMIQDMILPATPPQVVNETAEGVEGGVEGGVDTGVVGGSVSGVEGGEVGGMLGGAIGSVVVAETATPDTVVVKRDAPLPTAPMSMVFPKYPHEARVRGFEDTVVVRYIIGKNGRVRDVTVLNRPQRDVFREVTVKTIRNWRFRPYRKDGVAQEIVHELTVYFKLVA